MPTFLWTSLRSAMADSPAWRRIAALLAGATVVLIVCAAIGFALVHEAAQRQDSVERSADVQIAIERLRATLVGAGRQVQQDALRMGDAMQAVKAVRASAGADAQRLARLVRGDAEQARRVQEMQPLIDRRFDQLGALFDDAARTGADPMTNGRGLDQRLETTMRLEAMLGALAAHENALRREREQGLQSALRWQGALVVATVTLALAMLVLAFRQGLRQSEHRREIELQLHTLNAALESRVADRTTALDARNRALEAAQGRMETLSRQLLRVAEEEKRALARELHDDLGQRLAALKMNLQMAARDPAAAPLAERIEDSVHLVEGCIGQVRERAMSLRPMLLEEAGLAAALRWHADQQARRAGIGVSVEVDAALDGASDEWSGAVYRIVQEALRNAISHGTPSHVWIGLQREPGSAVLRVRDDGDGLGAEPRSGMGMLTMRERTELAGGTFALKPAQPRGVEIECRWPLPLRRAAAADAAATA